MSAVTRIRLAKDGVDALARELTPPRPDPGIEGKVAGILREVREHGDDAIVDHVRRFDAPGFTHDQIAVPRHALQEAAESLAPELRRAITTSAAQVRALAEATRPADVDVTLEFGQRIAVRAVPVAAVGVYAPGGRAPYPSSLIMAAVPARVAGVGRIAVASPPDAGGSVAPVVLATAALLGIDEVYAIGGPAAVAALAYGSGTVSSVAVVAGPGNAWVQEAKRQVFGAVGIDGLAGPSEVVVIADDTADPNEVAADLLAQAEHGPDSPAILVSPDAGVVEAVADALRDTVPVGSVTLVECESLAVAVLFAEAFAPEHLELVVRDAKRLAGHVANAGAVFIGANGATAFGDYVAGSNHILPTGGAARFASAVSPATFMRRMAVIDLPDRAVAALTPHLAALADAEGFTQHRRSAELRAERVKEGG